MVRDLGRRGRFCLDCSSRHPLPAPPPGGGELFQPEHRLAVFNSGAVAATAAAFAASALGKDRGTAIQILAILTGVSMVACLIIGITTNPIAFAEFFLWAILFAILLGCTLGEVVLEEDATGAMIAAGAAAIACGLGARWPAGWSIGILLIATDLAALPDEGEYNSWRDKRNPGVWTHLASLGLVAAVSATNVFFWNWWWVLPAALFAGATGIRLRELMSNK